MPYKCKYRINGQKHKWITDNPVNGLDENGYIQFSEHENNTYKILLEMLAFLNKVTKQHKIQYFAMSGTLLGACRNGGIIPHDNDIDVGVSLEYYDTLKWLSSQELDPNYCIQITESCGCRVYQTNGQRYPFIDIFLIGELDGKYQYAGPFYKNQPTFYLSRTFEQEWIDKEDIQTTITVPFENETIQIPQNADKWLKRVYGQDCYTRYVPDNRLPFLHELVTILPLYDMEQTIGLYAVDILQLNTKQKLDAQLINLIYQTINSTPLQLDQNPRSLIKKNMKHISKFIKANLPLVQFIH
jgi:phosphorylcholine metabolism protein LicD